MINYDVIVVGGGAAGMMAAGVAAKQGSSVLLLEKMFRPGRKLRITGKGRCNLTNLCSTDEFFEHVGEQAGFLNKAFSVFFAEDLIEFFHSIHIKTKIERGKRVFPQSDKAQDVVDGMHRWLQKSKVRMENNARVHQLLIQANKIMGVKLINGKEYHSKSVILCTGGASYPATGSTGDGYKLAKQAGHNINAIRPALVPLKLKETIPAELKGLMLKNINVRVYQQDKMLVERFGELQFLRHQISGPVVLSLSRELGPILEKNILLRFSVDLKPALSELKLKNRFQRELDANPNLLVRDLLRKLLPAKLMGFFVIKAKLSPLKPVKELKRDDIEKIILNLKNFSLIVTGLGDFSEAIITAGGIDLNEINSDTMESKKIKNLFFAGEIIDLDADTGGYNLQIAFSTANLAAMSAAKNRN